MKIEGIPSATLRMIRGRRDEDEVFRFFTFGCTQGSNVAFLQSLCSNRLCHLCTYRPLQQRSEEGCLPSIA